MIGLVNRVRVEIQSPNQILDGSTFLGGDTH
jgi:hypothetical protein